MISDIYEIYEDMKKHKLIVVKKRLDYRFLNAMSTTLSLYEEICEKQLKDNFMKDLKTKVESGSIQDFYIMSDGYIMLMVRLFSPKDLNLIEKILKFVVDEHKEGCGELYS